MFPKFPHIFETYFWRGEFAGLVFCHTVQTVDKGLQPFTTSDNIRPNIQWLKIIIHYFLLFVALVATTGCDKDDNYYPAPEFEGDPTAEYIEANVDFDTQISQENSDPDTFYTYFCLCNASDHKIYFTLTFCPTKNDEFIDHMNGLVVPEKNIQTDS